MQSHIAARCFNTSRLESVGGRHDRPAAEISPLDVFKWLCRIAVNGVALRPLLSARDFCTATVDAAGGGGKYGVAVYAATSMMNHSCRPNATLRWG